MALGLVLGANLGSGLLAMLATANAAPQVRRLPLGNLIFKVLGRARCFIVILPQVHVLLQQLVPDVHQQVVALPPRLQRRARDRSSSASPAWSAAPSSAGCAEPPAGRRHDCGRATSTRSR